MTDGSRAAAATVNEPQAVSLSSSNTTTSTRRPMQELPQTGAESNLVAMRPPGTVPAVL
uniref:Uncharacterized protein n=1 Tax=Macrostomum lignano TaxID=282301 RepID=A0A1I8F988_9PLAT